MHNIQRVEKKARTKYLFDAIDPEVHWQTQTSLLCNLAATDNRFSPGNEGHILNLSARPDIGTPGS